MYEATSSKKGIFDSNTNRYVKVRKPERIIPSYKIQ
jgi:hypothetical protein